MSRPDVTVRRYPDGDIAARRRALPAAVIGAVCVLLGPVLFGVGIAIWPWDMVAADGAPDSAAITDSAGLSVLAMNFTAFGCVCYLIGTLAIAALAIRRLPKTTTWGALITFVGLCPMLLYSVKDIPYLATRDVAPAAALQTWGVNYADQMYSVILYSLCPIAVVGMVMLAIALWRSRVVPPWAALCVGLGMGVLVAAILELGLLAIPFLVLALAGAIPVARATLALPGSGTSGPPADSPATAA